MYSTDAHEDMQFYTRDLWHVVHLQNHTSHPMHHWWSRDLSHESIAEWQAREYAEKEYPDAPVRLVRALWVPEIVQIHVPYRTTATAP